MALEIRYDKVTDWETVCVIDAQPGDERRHNVSTDGKRMNPVTEALGFTAMSTGIGEITAANAQEVYQRIYAVERCFGAYVWVLDDNGNRTPRYLTPADVLTHVGLWVNVFPKVSDAEFRKRLRNGLADAADRLWRHHADETQRASEAVVTVQ